MTHCGLPRHGYLFDMDGTLVDTHESNTSAYMQAIREVMPGLAVDRDLLRRHIAAGENYRDFLPVVAPGITAQETADVSAHKARCYASYIHLASLNESLIAKARSWREEPGALLALVTTAKRVNAEKVLAFFELDSLFDYMIFGDGIEHLKPAPDIYLRALSETGLTANEAEAFEDSQAGIDAATAAGLSVTRVTWATDDGVGAAC